MAMKYNTLPRVARPNQNDSMIITIEVINFAMKTLVYKDSSVDMCTRRLSFDWDYQEML